MKTNRRHKLKSLIQQSGLDQPLPDFTAMVMKDVNADQSEEFQLNDKLISLLQHYGTEKLPVNFTQLVMAELTALQEERSIQPVISIKTGLIVACSSAIAILIAVFSSSGIITNQHRPYPGISELNNLLNQISGSGTTIFYSLALILISILLISDYFLRYHKFKLR